MSPCVTQSKVGMRRLCQHNFEGDTFMNHAGILRYFNSCMLYKSGPSKNQDTLIEQSVINHQAIITLI